MKKWLTACLLAIALLFVATTAMAGHTKANGDYCLGGSYALLKEYENQHLLRCNDCQEEILENHWIGQEATCIRQAQCGGCTARFGDYGPHDWGEWKSNGNGAHTRVCKHNASHTETKDCTFSAAPCTVPAACTECGAVYKLGHDWGAWTSNGNKTHTHTCKRDASHIETENCNIQEATCRDPARCRECNGEYGSADPSKHEWMYSYSNGDGTHTRMCALDFTHTETSDCSGVRCGETGWCDECNERYTASHKFNGPWLSNPDKHWRACIYCNEAGSKTSHSFVEQPDARYLKSEATCASPAVYYKVCSDCGYQTPSTFESGDIDPNNHDLQRHEEVKAPTCTEKGWSAYYTCSRCDYTAYQETDALDHDWNDWTSNGNKTHTRTCKRDPSHTETEACSGVSCGDTGACSVCGGAYTVEHKYDESSWACDDAEHWRNCVYCHEKGEIASHSFEMHVQTAATCVSKAVYARVCSDCDYQGGNFIFGNINPDNHNLIPHAGKAATCTEKGWKAYNTCSRCDYSTYEELPALGHDPIPHTGKAATCTEPGWDAYDTCSRCDYSTYVELPIDPDNHDLVHHEAKAPTCTEIGWDAYDTCSRCDYSTYVELPIDPDNHDLVHHEAKAPTCTEIGWDAYDTCSRCDYTTKVEIPALEHDYTEKVVKPTCEKVGYTLHTCKKCQDSYKDQQTKKLLHWYGEWTNNGDGTHSAACKREDCKRVGKTECAIVEFKQDEATRTLCPVCGNVSDGTHLALVEEVKAEGEHLPYGELVLRMGETANGNTLLSVCFEVSGKLTRPKGEVKITLPAELLNGVTLALLNADGTEIDLPYIIEGENAVFTLDFTDAEIPTALIRLIPTAE